MKSSLFFMHYPLSPHLETELELMQIEIEKGNKVVVLRCNGVLSSCTYNMEHSKIKCLNCKNRISAALSQLDASKYTEVYLKSAPTKMPPLQSFQSVSDLMTYSYKGGYAIGSFVASTIISYLRDHGFSTIKYRKLIERQIASAQLLVDQFSELYERMHIDQAFLFNGRFSTVYSIMRACQVRNIDCYMHERGGVIDKYVLIKNSTPHNKANAHSQITQLWNETDMSVRSVKGAAFFEDRRNKVIQAWISFTAKQKEEFIRPEIKAAKEQGRKIITIYTSSVDEFFAFDEWRGANSLHQAEFLYRLFQRFANDTRFYFVVREHPNLKGLKNLQNREMQALVNMVVLNEFQNVCIVTPQDQVDSYSLLDFSDMVITFGSTIGAEATYWGRISILIDHAFYQGFDIAYEVDNLEQLAALVESADKLSPKPKENALKYGLWEYQRGIHFKYTQILGLFCAHFKNKPIHNRSVLSFFAKVSDRLYRKFKFDLR